MLVERWNTFTVLDTLDHKNVQNTRKVDLFSVQFDMVRHFICDLSSHPWIVQLESRLHGSSLEAAASSLDRWVWAHYK